LVLKKFIEKYSFYFIGLKQCFTTAKVFSTTSSISDSRIVKSIKDYIKDELRVQFWNWFGFGFNF